MSFCDCIRPSPVSVKPASCWPALLFASISILAASSARAEPKTVAFLGLTAKGVSKDVASNVADIVATEFGDMPGYKLITIDEINAMLGMEQLKDSLGCTETSCLAEIGGSLGADLVLAGSVGKLGDLYTVSLSLVDIGRGESAGRGQGQANDLSGLPKAARDTVLELTGRKASASAASKLRGKGSLFIQSNPAGATVSINGELAKNRDQQPLTTPATIDDIPAGDHVVTVTLADLSREIPVLIKPDKVNRYQLNLKVVRLKLTSVPFDAEVIFDGEPRGSTPVLLPEVTAGRYEVVFKKRGFKDSKMEVELDFDAYRKSGEAQVVGAQLQPLPVKVTITTEPKYAHVLIDGVDKGETPLVINDLLPGDYKMEFSLSGYRPETQKLAIKPAEPVEVKAKLVEFVTHASYVDSRRSHVLYAFGSAIGAGALLAGSGVLVGLAFLAKADADVQHEVYRSAIDPSAIADARQQRDGFEGSYAAYSYLSIGLAALGVAVGVLATYLFLTPPEEPDYTAETEVIAITPFVHPGTGTAFVTGRFVF